MIILFSILITIIIVSLAPRYIQNEEMNLLSSCNEISIERTYTKSYFLGGSLIVAPQLLLIFFSTEWLYQVLFMMLGVAAYFDIKRNWIPDPVIFLTLILSFFTILHYQRIDLLSACANSLFFTLPYFVFNAISFIASKKYIFYSGDVYIIVSLSFSISPLTGLITTSLAIFSALLFMLISKRREIPFIPFLLLSFLTSHLTTI